MGVGGEEMIKFFKNQKGSAVLFELAVMIPIMIMLFYGFSMFTNALATDIALKTAAREGAREYAITGDASEGVRKARVELEASKVYSNITILPFTEDEGRGVRVSKKVSFMIPFAKNYEMNLEGVGLFINEPLR